MEQFGSSFARAVWLGNVWEAIPMEVESGSE